MCNRILGVTPRDSNVSESEWNQLADDLDLTATGSVTAGNRMQYYRERGWCVELKLFHGTTEDYEELAERRNVDGCDVKLSYFLRRGDEFVNGHVETVTGVTGQTATTNSWGHLGVVEGGADGGFRHSGDGDWMQAEDGDRLWTANETDVLVTYVCECQTSRMERLAQWLFGD